MKTTSINAIITTAALAAAVCAFSTLPEGHALSEQERMAVRGRLNVFTTHCHRCTPGTGGEDCTYNKGPGEGDPCTEVGALDYSCDGKKGDGRTTSKTRDVYTFGNEDGRTLCLRLFYSCNQEGENPNNLIWQRTDLFDYEGCGVYTDCNDEQTSTPKKCDPNGPGE